MGVISIYLPPDLEDWLEEQTDNKSAFIQETLWMRKRDNPDLTKRAIKKHKRKIKKHKEKIKEHEEKIEELKSELKKEKKRTEESEEEGGFYTPERERMKEWIEDFESEKTDKKIKRIRRENREKIEEYGSREKFVNAEGGKVYQKFINKWGEELGVSPGMVDKYLKYIEKVKEGDEN